MRHSILLTMMVTIVNSKVVCEDNGMDACVSPQVPVPFVCDDKGVDGRCQTVSTTSTTSVTSTSTSSAKVENVQSGGEMINVGKWMFAMISVMVL